MDQLNEVLVKLTDILNYIVLIFSRITWLEIEIAQLAIIAIISYLAALIILWKIHQKILKKYLNTQKEYTYQYDKLIYIISKEEYTNQRDSSANPIKEILNTPIKNYIANHEIIINAVRKLESDTKQILLSPDTEKTINQLHKKIKNLNTIQKLFWIFLSIITLGAYILFR